MNYKTLKEIHKEAEKLMEHEASKPKTKWQSLMSMPVSQEEAEAEVRPLGYTIRVGDLLFSYDRIGGVLFSKRRPFGRLKVIRGHIW